MSLLEVMCAEGENLADAVGVEVRKTHRCRGFLGGRKLGTRREKVSRNSKI